MNTELLRELFSLFATSDASTLKFDQGGASLHLSRAGAEHADVAHVARSAEATAPVIAATGEVQPAARSIFPSPMVGTFYSAPAPGASPLVKVGEKVPAGATVCIIEAMKILNEVQIDRAGVITEVLVRDGDLVEYGQPLFALGESAC